MEPTRTFVDYCQRKEREAASAAVGGYATLVEDIEGLDLLPLGTGWSRSAFDGDFYRSAGGRSPDLPVVTLVHDSPPQDPRGEGGPGPLVDATTMHLLHEGLARVDADAVLGGIGVVREPHFVASVWHPELVELRRARGLARHPVQVVVTHSGHLPFDECVLFNEPSLQVVLVTARRNVRGMQQRAAGRPWIRVLDAGEPFSMRRVLAQLRADGIAVVSALGGRRVASTLLSEALVTDLYLTSAGPEGARDIHDGPPVLHRRVLLKEGRETGRTVRFEHLVSPVGHPWVDALTAARH